MNGLIFRIHLSGRFGNPSSDSQSVRFLICAFQYTEKYIYNFIKGFTNILLFKYCCHQRSHILKHRSTEFVISLIKIIFPRPYWLGFLNLMTNLIFRQDFNSKVNEFIADSNSPVPAYSECNKPT